MLVVIVSISLNMFHWIGNDVIFAVFRLFDYELNCAHVNWQMITFGVNAKYNSNQRIVIVCFVCWMNRAWAVANYSMLFPFWFNLFVVVYYTRVYWTNTWESVLSVSRALFKWLSDLIGMIPTLDINSATTRSNLFHSFLSIPQKSDENTNMGKLHNPNKWKRQYIIVEMVHLYHFVQFKHSHECLLYSTANVDYLVKKYTEWENGENITPKIKNT